MHQGNRFGASENRENAPLGFGTRLSVSIQRVAPPWERDASWRVRGGRVQKRTLAEHSATCLLLSGARAGDPLHPRSNGCPGGSGTGPAPSEALPSPCPLPQGARVETNLFLFGSVLLRFQNLGAFS